MLCAYIFNYLLLCYYCRDELSRIFESAFEGDRSNELYANTILSAGLSLVRFYFANGLFARGFDQEMMKLSTVVESEENFKMELDDKTKAELSLYWDLKAS